MSELNIVLISEWPPFSEEQLKKLKGLGNFVWHKKDFLGNEEFLELAKDADILLTVHFTVSKLSKEILEKLPKLKMIAQLATGYDYLDLEQASKQGITVCNVPAYASNAVTELTFALILNLLRKTNQADNAVKKGDYDFRNFLGQELAGKTLGLIGLGAIGKTVGKIGKAFGMKVIASDPKPHDGIKIVPLEDLLKQADIVSLHCPLLKSTQGLINKERLQLMKPSALLINTARAAIIVEKEVIQALQNKVIAGFAADLINEPLSKDNPLLAMENVVLTPHIGWYTKEAVKNLLNETIENVEAFIKGKPKNVVNK